MDKETMVTTLFLAFLKEVAFKQTEKVEIHF